MGASDVVLEARPWLQRSRPGLESSIDNF